MRGTSFGPTKELLLDLNRDLMQPPLSPLCPILMVPDMGIKLSYLQRRADSLPRHQRRPGEAAPKWPGLPGQVDRQLLAWRSVLTQTEPLSQAHRLRDHSWHFTLRHWQRREVEHLPGFEAIRGLWITRLLGLGTGQRIATVALPPSWP